MIPEVPLGDSELQSQTLESLSVAANYHDWLSSLALPYLGEHPFEVGSGLGDYAAAWLAAGVPRITVSEADEMRVRVLLDRFGGDPRVEVRRVDILDPPVGEHSAMVGFNVLEHIPDHVRALRAAHGLVQPGGAVLMFVPAFEFAMSAFDRRVGHVRRYTRRTLAAVYADAGVRVEEVYYVNSPGLPAWFLGMRLFGMMPRGGPLLRAWDRLVVPAARAIEARFRPPFGQSVFAVGRVPGGGP
jgi:hypothetical protein